MLAHALSNVATSSNDLVVRLDAITATPGDFVNLDPSVVDRDAGVDRGSVLRIDFAPPEPGTARPVRQTATTQSDLAPRRSGGGDDGGPVVFTLDG